MCLAQKGNNQSHDSSRGDGNKRGSGRKNFRSREVDITMVRDFIFTVFVVARRDMRQRHIEFHGRRS